MYRPFNEPSTSVPTTGPGVDVHMTCTTLTNYAISSPLSRHRPHQLQQCDRAHDVNMYTYSVQDPRRHFQVAATMQHMQLVQLCHTKAHAAIPHACRGACTKFPMPAGACTKWPKYSSTRIKEMPAPAAAFSVCAHVFDSLIDNEVHQPPSAASTGCAVHACVVCTPTTLLCYLACHL